jgi:hypothetical protein
MQIQSKHWRRTILEHHVIVFYTLRSVHLVPHDLVSSLLLLILKQFLYMPVAGDPIVVLLILGYPEFLRCIFRTPANHRFSKKLADVVSDYLIDKLAFVD